MLSGRWDNDFPVPAHRVRAHSQQVNPHVAWIRPLGMTSVGRDVHSPEAGPRWARAAGKSAIAANSVECFMTALPNAVRIRSSNTNSHHKCVLIVATIAAKEPTDSGSLPTTANFQLRVIPRRGVRARHD